MGQDREVIIGLFIGLCVVGIAYFGAMRIRDEVRQSTESKYRWGDPQRRAPAPTAWWAQDWFLAAMAVLLVALLRVVLRATQVD